MRLWLLGEGIASSPSPEMQRAALATAGIDGTYELVEVDAAGLGAVLDRLRAGEAHGANVTIPHKRAVAAACSRLEGDALITSAVNTVTAVDGELVGDSTDARGLEGALREQGAWPEPGSTAVVTGAGGAAAAAVLTLARAGCEPIVVTARRAIAAHRLAAELAGAAPVLVAAFDRRALDPWLTAAGIVVNATPAGLDALPLDLATLDRGCGVVDLRYRPRPVDLVAAARLRGLRAVDGAGMLLHQGMLSFHSWTGLAPPWDAARAALEAALAQGA